MATSLLFWWQLIRLGARSLLMHKLRSALTVMGMVFGVGSVVSILAIGEGASHEVQAQLRRLGPGWPRRSSAPGRYPRQCRPRRLGWPRRLGRLPTSRRRAG